MAKTYTEQECQERSDKSWDDGRKQAESDSAEHIKTLESRVEELESELYKLKLLGSGGAAGVEAVVTVADADRRRFEAVIAEKDKALATLSAMIADFTPLEILVFPLNRLTSPN